MAIRNIVLEGEEILRKKSRPVTEFDERLWQLLDDMKETLADAQGAGLAAPQVGVLRCAVIVDAGEGPIELVNPEIIEKSRDTLDEYEGCLSSPGEFAVVRRPAKVKAKAFDRHGKEFEIEGEGLLARAICHEYDHLIGVLFKDKARSKVERRTD
jgi:peptide deformylase